MPVKKDRREVRGSTKSKVPGATLVGDVRPDERVEVTVRLRARPGAAGLAAPQLVPGQRISDRKYLTRQELAAATGADPADMAKIEAFASEHGLDVVQWSLPQRKVILGGPASSISKAFDVRLRRYRSPKGTYRGRTGPVTVPASIADIVEGVFGLDDRAVARPHFRALRGRAKAAASSKKGGRAKPRAGAVAYTPPQIASLYGFPTSVNGSGQCIAIIELGGGWRQADLTAYFQGLGIPVPNVVSVSVDGGQNHPTTPNSADGEVMLDIEVAGAVAPAAEIVVYFAPNTDQGFLDAVTSAVHDSVHNPSVISISWGAAESAWTDQAMTAMDQAFQEAAAVGVTVFCASGDNGSDDGVGDGRSHVDFPASSPNAVACGGTHLEGSGSSITSEVVWNDGGQGGAGGGGVSDFFDPPSYQAGAGVPPSANPGGRRGRGVPDISGDASPQTGYRVRVDGQNLVFGGTSAVAPLWAGLTALLNQALGAPVGFFNPALYGQAAAAGALRDITGGSNGAYQAGSGWDPCTGLGSPRGAQLLAALQGPVAPPPPPPGSPARSGSLKISAGKSSAVASKVSIGPHDFVFATLAGDGSGADVPGLWITQVTPDANADSFGVFLNQPVPAGRSAQVAWLVRTVSA
jgi:kumamolisin